MEPIAEWGRGQGYAHAFLQRARGLNAAYQGQRRCASGRGDDGGTEGRRRTSSVSLSPTM
jgi:hypothetical protein